MAARKKTPAASTQTPIDALTHKDTRKNIPTLEQSELVADEEQQAQEQLYPRDPSLDPQLVWKGKDEQDREGLRVPVVPIYIQEKIEPKALIENLRREIKGEQLGVTGDLFEHFHVERDFEQGIEFYKHDDQWTNRMILGDSLVVMASLLHKEGLRGKVQTIYMDPPYGIKFGSNWQVSTRKREVKDGKEEDLIRQPEQLKAFRDTWQLGIHSYLAYLRDRLTIARELLTESGSIFVQISDENVHLVRCLMDEIFGQENFISLISFRKKTMPFGTTFIEQMSDFIIWYGKKKFSSDGKICTSYFPLKKDANVEGEFHHCWFEMPDGTRQRMSPEQINNHALLPYGASVYRLKSLEPSGPMESGRFDYCFEGISYAPPKNGYGTTPVGMCRLETARRLVPEGNRLTFVMYANENSASALTTPWFDTVGADDKQYVVQTNTEVVRRCLLMTTKPGDIVLDPTCGSGTTPFVAEKWGRRWIAIDTSRVALAIARMRLTGAQYPYFILNDSIEGQKKMEEVDGIKASHQPLGDVRQGFVYKKVSRITLGSITNNEEIDGIKDFYEQAISSLEKDLNSFLNKKWNRWEIPQTADKNWPAQAKEKHEDYWKKRRERQKKIDASIARHADSETLYDRPYEDTKRVRVTGPFTVESLSPHRLLTPPSGEKDTKRRRERQAEFVQTILENVRAAGVQNTVKGERLVLERVTPFAGRWLQGEAEARDAEGRPQRVAVSVGPEHGTVGPEQVREAIREAKGHFEMLVVLGFAFDSHAYEEAKEHRPKAQQGKEGGGLTVLLSHMNPDLQMGDALKKTGAGNLFMVFGEPDIELRKRPDGQYEVEIKGLDIYDPTKGEVRSSKATEDLACWFLDTDYDGESFFVRHAYFTGGNDPYEKLKRALRAEIDEDAWGSLYRTVSRPFPAPKGGLLAVKVINHYGDEVLKVYPVGSGSTGAG